MNGTLRPGQKHDPAIGRPMRFAVEESTFGPPSPWQQIGLRILLFFSLVVQKLRFLNNSSIAPLLRFMDHRIA
jgi:hypothetical protein